MPKEKSDGQVQHAVGCKITFGDNQVVICHFRVTRVNSQWKLSNVESNKNWPGATTSLRNFMISRLFPVSGVKGRIVLVHG